MTRTGMPVSASAAVLNPAMRDVERVQALLTPYPAEEMVAFPVSPRVHNPAYDAPECIVPVT